MDRRKFLLGLSGFAACPVCDALSRRARAAEALHWGYSGADGPEHWGQLSKDTAVCGVGGQQSPIDIQDAIKASLPGLKIDWPKSGGTITNNGHTIQVNLAEGSFSAGDRSYQLVQYHFHAPSEHLVSGKRYAMEAHFVHKAAQGGGLGVIGVLMEPGRSNPAFAKLTSAMPREAGKEGPADGVDPREFLPRSLGYWRYEGSLTTPPCSEVVDWIVLEEPIQAAEADIGKFTALYPMNARPAQSANRRFVLKSA
jgi:carbonic anhydrase